ncbi:MAG: hypothetical protein CVV46_02800 [Spirochaetae bacterium HGW-Spirochaetae-2]|jgi:xylulokinase|nr:MAG: hypothetical protein CVV46_02800 [Spirochaetae bacterium HGW-Spirochaetae-2]
MSIMGLDIGTSGCKVLAVSEEGKILARAGAEYPVDSPDQGRFELDPIEVWHELKSCIRQCNALCKDNPVTALSFSTQGEAVIPVDAMMHPLDKSPVSADIRGLGYVASLRSILDEQQIFNLTGQTFDSIHSIFKIKWWMDHHKRVRENCWKYCCFDTFILLCLGLPPVTDRSMAARMLLYDVKRKSWSSTLLGFAGITENQLPEIIDSGSVIGILSCDVSLDLGFTVRPKVVSGGHDQPCSAFGNGLIRKGASYSVGTTECISIVQSKEQAPHLVRYPTYPHVCPGSMVTLVGSQTGTRFFSWLGSVLFAGYNGDISCKLEDFYNLLRTVPSDLETSVQVIPHLSGGSNHYDNPHAKALVYGFTYNSTQQELLKAVMEGITFEQYLGFIRFKELHGCSENDCGLVATGGGVRFKNWISMKSDIFALPIQLMSVHEAGCIGSAMLAGWGTGVFESLEQAVRQCVKKEIIVRPNDGLAPYYTKKVKQYDLLYQSIKELAQEEIV